MSENFNSLQTLLNKPDLHFTDIQVTTLLNHVGDLDPDIRDSLVYTLFCRGFEEHAFTPQQRQQIIQLLLQEHWLFKAIDQPTNDFVFLRTFTALLTTEILLSDAESGWLSQTERQQFFNDALTYLSAEHDQRGFVEDKGWAHGIAHGSDLLGAAWQHPEFPNQLSEAALTELQGVLTRQTQPFIADEEPRLAQPLLLALQHNKLTDSDLSDWLRTTNQLLWHPTTKPNSAMNVSLHNWISLIHHLYFWLSDTNVNRQVITDLSNYYYRQNGYLQ